MTDCRTCQVLAQRLATALAELADSRELSEYRLAGETRLRAEVERLHEDLEESRRVEKLYYSQLCKTQIALDMRCVDNPKQVGCADTLFDVADAASKLCQRAEAAQLNCSLNAETALGYAAKLAAAQQREAWWRELATIYWIWNRRESFAVERQRDDELCHLLGVDGRLLGLDDAQGR